MSWALTIVSIKKKNRAQTHFVTSSHKIWDLEFYLLKKNSYLFIEDTLLYLCIFIEDIYFAIIFVWDFGLYFYLQIIYEGL